MKIGSIIVDKLGRRGIVKQIYSKRVKIVALRVQGADGKYREYDYDEIEGVTVMKGWKR